MPKLLRFGLKTCTTLPFDIWTIRNMGEPSLCVRSRQQNTVTDTIKSTESFLHAIKEKCGSKASEKPYLLTSLLSHSLTKSSITLKTSVEQARFATLTMVFGVLCVVMRVAFCWSIFNFANCLTDNTIADLNTIHSEITLYSIPCHLLRTVLCSTCLQIACEIARLTLVRFFLSLSNFTHSLCVVVLHIYPRCLLLWMKAVRMWIGWVISKYKNELCLGFILE